MALYPAIPEARRSSGEARRQPPLPAAHPDSLAPSGLSEVRFGTWRAATGLLQRMGPATAHYAEPFHWSE